MLVRAWLSGRPDVAFQEEVTLYSLMDVKEDSKYKEPLIANLPSQGFYTAE